MNGKILIVDDDERILVLITQILSNSGFYAVGALDAQVALVRLNAETFDAVVVDCMMPTQSGIEFVGNLRNSGNITPIIMLTAVNDIGNKLAGFKNGIDDYITKPFDDRELVARLNRMVDRNNSRIIVRFGQRFNEYEFNIKNGKLSRSGKEVYLTSSESLLLSVFCKNPNTAISRAELAASTGFTVSDRTIDVRIARLRQKIGDTQKNPTIIRSVRHIGYMLAAV